MNVAIGNVMIQNGERTRVTNEVMQGIRGVKFTGLEDIFVNRVAESRGKQCRHLYSFYLIRS